MRDKYETLIYCHFKKEESGEMLLTIINKRHTRGTALSLHKLYVSKYIDVEINHDKTYVLIRKIARSNIKEHKDMEQPNDTEKADTTSNKKKRK